MLKILASSDIFSFKFFAQSFKIWNDAFILIFSHLLLCFFLAILLCPSSLSSIFSLFVSVFDVWFHTTAVHKTILDIILYCPVTLDLFCELNILKDIFNTIEASAFYFECVYDYWLKLNESIYQLRSALPYDFSYLESSVVQMNIKFIFSGFVQFIQSCPSLTPRLQHGPPCHHIQVPRFHHPSFRDATSNIYRMRII